jgi:hypothetical protein
MTEEEKKKDEQQTVQEQPTQQVQEPVKRPSWDYMPTETGNENQEEAVRQYREQLFAANDPAKRAEEDRRTRAGRAFWTGATIAANTVANAINVNGTGNYAPSMTWDTGQQKMLDDWRAHDAELAKQRREADERIMKLGLTEAELRDAGVKARNAAAEKGYGKNYDLDVYDYKRGNEAADKAATEQKRVENQKEIAKINNDSKERIAKISANSRSTKNNKNDGGGSFAVGNMVFSGMPKGADGVIINQLFNLMKKAKRVTTNEDGTQKVEPWLSLREMNQTKLADIANVVNQHFDDIWNSDPEFNENLVRFFQNYGRYQSGWMCKIGDTTVYDATEGDEQSNGGQQNNKSNNSNNNNSGGKKSYHL